MTKAGGFLVAITALNLACVAVSVAQLPRANAAPASEVSDVVRTRHLEVLDGVGRVRASITVHPAKGDEEETVVLRLVNPQGMPGVKLALSETKVGLSMLAKQGNYIQVFDDGIKVTKEFKQRAAWP